ncbi:penicillin binding protein PBP4B [Butyrivibrio sp. VCB2006]|uniref:penicillin binding protein PBP4B n=1 Tax=Butyrivibrio sp. VCB2006 TaxID=1280679 RepID=UPI000405BEEB|nr:penicillin binding protein PBP4B [Butyrivibrio sp. VCB2006]
MTSNTTILKHKSRIIVLLLCSCLITGCAGGTGNAGNSGDEGINFSDNSSVHNAQSAANADNSASSPETNTSDTSESGQDSSSSSNPAEDPAFPFVAIEDSGIRRECLTLIDDIIECDVMHGFTSAQLTVIRNGKIVYEGTHGYVNSYNPDGTPKTDSARVTTNTLYDLASVSKMIGVNYALQKLVTDGEIDINDKVVSYLGQHFVDDTIYIDYEEGSHEPLETIKEWKANLTIADLLSHQGGFPPSPKYHNPTINPQTLEYDPEIENPLYSAVSADKAAKQATTQAICKTPLMFESGTKVLYSDVDYMILGLIVEAKTGKDLDTYLKETFCEPMGLTHVTYNPLENGFSKDDCAATELNGNTRDGFIEFDGIRTQTIQGQVHDEMAYYCMGGMSGHAGLFANSVDLAKLGTLMLDGTYGDTRFFSQEVIDQFTAPKSDDYKNWGLGWWRQGDMQRTNYFGSYASSNTFGHQGWTGTLLMIDPEKDLVIAYLTNKINSPVTDKDANPNKFNGNWYTSATLGFVPELIYMGMDSDEDIEDELLEYIDGLVETSKEAITDDMPEDHPARKNAEAKEFLWELYHNEGFH